jgi:hypothetical protein
VFAVVRRLFLVGSRAERGFFRRLVASGDARFFMG